MPAPLQQRTPICSSRVQHAIAKSVDVAINRLHPGEADFVSANLAIIEAVLPELTGDALARAHRTQRDLENQLSALRVYGEGACHG